MKVQTILIATVVLSGCASVWWRDSSVNAQRKCCWTGSQWGEPTGCLVYADDDGKCPEKAP